MVLGQKEFLMSLENDAMSLNRLRRRDEKANVEGNKPSNKILECMAYGHEKPTIQIS